MSNNASISVERFAELAKQDALPLLDVRTPTEFREVHAISARNTPLETLDPNSLLADGNGAQPERWYVICKTGSRGAAACRRLESAGLQVVNLEGGTDAWLAAGLPVVRGKKAISLERQVRIAAGFLVLVGALLAIFVNRYFAGLSAFVGAGLMFAGITDTCGMGMLIARMPWNQVKEQSTEVCLVGETTE